MMKAVNKNIFELLTEYGQSDYYPFHMPGHKRNPKYVNICTTDITEVEKFDDLHDPKGIIKAAMERAAEVYGSEETYFLINGSTCGILSAVGTCCDPGDHILVTRGCHKAVYNSIYINRLKPVFNYPELDPVYGFYKCVDASRIRKALSEDPLIKAVIIVSPTYEGVVSDIKGIARVCHKAGVPLIVDEAHGAHFGFHEMFSESSVKYADIVIHSLHKTLPSLTQTGLLHVKGNLVDRDKLRYMLTCYQSSSPSYIFMASIDKCIEFLAESKEAFDEYEKLLKHFRSEMKKLQRLTLIPNDDPSRLLIGVKDGSGAGMEIYRRLYEEHHIQMEMVTPYYVVGISTVCDRKEGMIRLLEACREIDMYIEGGGAKALTKVIKPEKVLDPWADKLTNRENVPISDAAGRISAEYIYLYPPGSPMLMPGEKVSADMIIYIQKLIGRNFDVKGIHNGEISVLK